MLQTVITIIILKCRLSKCSLSVQLCSCGITPLCFRRLNCVCSSGVSHFSLFKSSHLRKNVPIKLFPGSSTRNLLEKYQQSQADTRYRHKQNKIICSDSWSLQMCGLNSMNLSKPLCQRLINYICWNWAAYPEVTWQRLVSILVHLYSYLRCSHPARPTERKKIDTHTNAQTSRGVIKVIKNWGEVQVKRQWKAAWWCRD